MISRYFLAAFLMMALVFLYLAWTEDSGWAVFIIPPVILAAVAYVFSPQLDWWQYRRNPPPVPKPFFHMIRKKSRFFNRLSPSGQRRLLERLMLYVKAHHYSGQAMKMVPEDAKMVLAHYVAMLTFHREDFLMKPFERIVFYPHPFPSPDIPDLHISEHHESDGVLIFSLPHMMKAFLNPRSYFQPALYELGLVCRSLWKEEGWPEPFPAWEDQMAAISGFPKEKLGKVIGKEVDFLGVAVHHFFQFPESFQAALPDLYQRLSSCLRVDPRFPDSSSS